MNRARILSVLIIAVILASGCTGSDSPVQNNTQPNASDTINKTPAAPPVEEKLVYFVSAPESATIGDFANITWGIDGGNGTTHHTAIHYDYVSHPGKFGTNVTVKASGYEKLTPDYANGSYVVPRAFNAKIQLVQTGALYYRAHTVIGDANYWTEERNITITPKAAEVVTDRRNIEADDSGFYSNNKTISAISVSFGHVMNIAFSARSANVEGGLSFRGCGQSAEGIWAGNSAEFAFTANNTCNITSYSTVTNASKATLQVMVGKPYSQQAK